MIAVSRVTISAICATRTRCQTGRNSLTSRPWP